MARALFVMAVAACSSSAPEGEPQEDDTGNGGSVDIGDAGADATVLEGGGGADGGGPLNCGGAVLHTSIDDAELELAWSSPGDEPATYSVEVCFNDGCEDLLFSKLPQPIVLTAQVTLAADVGATITARNDAGVFKVAVAFRTNAFNVDTRRDGDIYSVRAADADGNVVAASRQRATYKTSWSGVGAACGLNTVVSSIMLTDIPWDGGPLDAGVDGSQDADAQSNVDATADAATE